MGTQVFNAETQRTPRTHERELVSQIFFALSASRRWLRLLRQPETRVP